MNKEGEELKLVEVLTKLSDILGTGLDKQMIPPIQELIQCGVHPESIVDGKCLFQDAFI